MPAIVGEYVDRLVTVTMKPRRRLTRSGSTLSQRGHIPKLYQAARRRCGEPLTYLAAKLLLERVQPGDSVVIVTGAGGPPHYPMGEVDGYLGTAALARALMLGRKAPAVVVAEERCWAPLVAAFRGADMILKRPGEEYMAISATFEPLPIDTEGSRRRAAELMDYHRPKAVVAIERLGPNSKEVIHGATGISFDHVQCKAQHLFDLAAARRIATVGIGDGGNEIGFGLIEDDVREILPHGTRCQCPCGGGVACRVATDVLVVAGISNWGGYGVAANIAFQLEKPRVFITADTLERMLRNCVEAGAVDGQSSRPEVADDGVPLVAHRACVDILNTLITIAASEVDDPAH